MNPLFRTVCLLMCGLSGIGLAETIQAQPDIPDRPSRAKYSVTAIDTVGRTVTVGRHWGKVVFFQGFPRSLKLKYGSGEDLLPGFALNEFLGAVEYNFKGKNYTTLHDIRMVRKVDGESVHFQSRLLDEAGNPSPDGAYCVLTWTVSEYGYIKLDAAIKTEESFPTGIVSYTFPFDGSHLNRYYYTGYQPASVRGSSSLRKDPLLELSTPGQILHFTDNVLSRVLGFIRTETEALNFVGGSGFLSELSLDNGPPAVVSYVDNTPERFAERRASFYLLPAPTKKHRTLHRMLVQVPDVFDEVGGIEAFMDTLEVYGIKVHDS